jgi:hypothetical protein
MLLNPAAILAKTHRKWTQVLWPRSPVGHVWNLIGDLQRKQEKESSSNSSLQKQQQTLAMQLVLFTSDQNTPNHIHETLVHKLRNIMRELRSNFPAFSSSITQQPLKKPKDCLMACDIVAWLETDTETEGALYPLQRKQVCREQCRARWPERPQRWQGPMLPINWVAAKSSTFPPLLIFLNSSVYGRSVRMLKIREAPVPLFLHRDLLWSDLTYSIREILLSIPGEGVSYGGQKLMTILEEGNQCPEC